MGRLEGKVAIITGAAMGMGAEEAKLFAREGAKVIATDIREELLQRVVEEIKREGGEAIAIKHDVSSENDWKNVVKLTVDRYNRLNILVNNAGIGILKKVEETTLDDWWKTLGVNATSVFLGMRYVIPEMRKYGGGSIVNISSMSGIIGFGGAAYNASKGAIRTMTKNAALDYAKDNIRINSVHPGVIVTPMTEPYLKNEETKALFERMTPLPRLGEPKDVAYGVLYLASDESSFVTGAELIIDGGWTAL